METYQNPYMKNCTILLIVTCFLSLSPPVFSQVSKELAPGYYVVVGAYAKTRENMAQNYVEILKLRGFKASYGFNTSRNLYFVYLNYFTDLKASLRDMSATRKKGEFKDAWVRVVPGSIVAKTEPQPTPAEKEAPAAKATPLVADKKDPVPDSNTTTPTDTVTVTDNPEIKQYPKMTLGNTEVFLSLYNGRNNRIVEGDVTVIDTERSKQMTK